MVCKTFGASGKGAREALKVLLNGGAGLIGSHVADLLIACGYEVVVVDDLLSDKRENVPQGARFYEMDVRSGCAEVFERFNPRSCATKRQSGRAPLDLGAGLRRRR